MRMYGVLAEFRSFKGDESFCEVYDYCYYYYFFFILQRENSFALLFLE